MAAHDNDKANVRRLTGAQLLAAQEQITEWQQSLDSRYRKAFGDQPDKLEECNGYTWVAYLKALKYGEFVNAPTLAYSVVRHVRNGMSVNDRSHWRKGKPNTKKKFAERQISAFDSEDDDRLPFFQTQPAGGLEPPVQAMLNEALALA